MRQLRKLGADAHRQPVLLAFVLLCSLIKSAAAADPQFRILFTGHDAEVVTAGEAGAHNAAEMKRIAAAIGRLSSLGTVRFIFVARREGICAANCAPEHLMWQRVNAATAALRTVAVRTGTTLPFQKIGWSFLHELPAGTMLPPAGTTNPGIDLMVLVDESSTGTCPWQVLVHDPTLPMVIGAHASEPVIPVSHGRSIALGQGARVAIKLTKSSAGAPLAVWQDANGGVRKVDAAVVSATGTALPPDAVRLVMLVPGSAEARELAARLTDGTRDYAASNGTRGFDDHGSQAPRQILPAAETMANRCEFGFKTASE